MTIDIVNSQRPTSQGFTVFFYIPTFSQKRAIFPQTDAKNDTDM